MRRPVDDILSSRPACNRQTHQYSAAAQYSTEQWPSSFGPRPFFLPKPRLESRLGWARPSGHQSSLKKKSMVINIKYAIFRLRQRWFYLQGSMILLLVTVAVLGLIIAGKKSKGTEKSLEQVNKLAPNIRVKASDSELIMSSRDFT